MMFAPLAVLPFRSAQAVWIVIGLVPLSRSLRILARELVLSRAAITALVLTFLSVHGTALVWWQGQTAWWLLWPATEAWRRHCVAERVLKGNASEMRPRRMR